MKAITVKYQPYTNTKPARYKAVDSDGNYYVSSENTLEAALGLCNKMGWSGTMARGGSKAGEVFVFVEPTDLIYMDEGRLLEPPQAVTKSIEPLAHCLNCGQSVLDPIGNINTLPWSDYE